MSGPTPYAGDGKELFTEERPAVVILGDLLKFIEEVRDIYDNVQDLSQALEDKIKEISNIEKNRYMTELYKKLDYSLPSKLNFPSGWSWTSAPINIYKTINGKITTDFDVSAFKKPSSKTYYVNKDTGHNTNNDGLTEATPLKSLWAGLQKPDVDTVIIADGYYDRSNGFAGYNVTRSVNIVAKNKGKVTFSLSDDTLSWTKTSGQTNVYQTTRSATTMVYDKKFIDSYGDYLKLTKVDTVQQVNDTPNSWCFLSNVVYVRTSDNRIPDTNIRVFLDLNHINIVGDVQTFYLEGCNVEGGKECINTEGLTNPQLSGVYIKDSTFKYTNGTNVYRTWGVSKVYSQNVTCAWGRLDGFNYHVFNGVVPDVIEVDCVGRHNGIGNGDSNNGSTMHDGGRIIRVNGNYFKNSGPNVIDVNENAQSWCVGTTAHDSVATVNTISNSDFKCGNVGKTQMWLDSVVSFNSSYSVVTAGAGSPSVATVKDSLLLNPNYKENNTVIN